MPPPRPPEGDGDMVEPILRQRIGEEDNVALAGKRIDVHGCVPGCAAPRRRAGYSYFARCGEGHLRDMLRDDPVCLD